LVVAVRLHVGPSVTVVTLVTVGKESRAGQFRPAYTFAFVTILTSSPASPETISTFWAGSKGTLLETP
jgi:hypothetical protein